MGPDCLLGVVPQPTDSRLSETKALLAMLSALRLVAGSKHAPGAFDSAIWQAGASLDVGINKTNQHARKVNEQTDLYKNITRCGKTISRINCFSAEIIII